jgi:hypothetical protein
MKERLEQLAKIVENFEDFDQRWHTTCVVGLARQIYKEETGNKPKGISYQDEDVADYFGLTVNEVDALYCAEYSRLNIGMEDIRPSLVTRAIAADVVRRLAARE